MSIHAVSISLKWSIGFVLLYSKISISPLEINSKTTKTVLEILFPSPQNILCVEINYFQLDTLKILHFGTEPPSRANLLFGEPPSQGPLYWCYFVQSFWLKPFQLK